MSRGIFFLLGVDSAEVVVLPSIFLHSIFSEFVLYEKYKANIVLGEVFFTMHELAAMLMCQ